jgi:hypothetical protein
VPKEVTPVLIRKREDTGVMRGRDVRQKLQHKIDPDLCHVLETLAEINHTNVLAIAELATMFNQMVDTMQNFANIAENMKTRTDQLVRSTEAEVAGEEGAENTKH